jgi:hypothetical protein
MKDSLLLIGLEKLKTKGMLFIKLSCSAAYNHLGPESLGDQRCKNTDCDPLLNDVEQAQLWQVRKQPPPDGGLWNGRKVAHWMSELKGEKVCRLHRVGISQVHEVSIESSSPPTPGIRYPQNLRSGKKICVGSS